jgi:hypothetical protein
VGHLHNHYLHHYHHPASSLSSPCIIIIIIIIYLQHHHYLSSCSSLSQLLLDFVFANSGIAFAGFCLQRCLVIICTRASHGSITRD